MLQIQHWRTLTQVTRWSRIRLEGGKVQKIVQDGLFNKQQRQSFSDQNSSPDRQTYKSTNPSHTFWKDQIDSAIKLDASSGSDGEMDEHQKMMDSLISLLNDSQNSDLDRVGAYKDLRESGTNLLSQLTDDGIRLLSEQAIQQGYTHLTQLILEDLSTGQFGLKKGSLRHIRALCSIISNLKIYFEQFEATENDMSTMENQIGRFYDACTQSMGIACRILNDDVMMFRNETSNQELMQIIGPDTAFYLSISVALMDSEYELIPLVSALLDIVLFDPPKAFKDINRVRIFADTLIRYLLHPEWRENFDEISHTNAFSYAIKITESIDQFMSINGMSSSLKSELYSQTGLMRLMYNHNHISKNDQDSARLHLFVRSTVASLLLQSGSYSASMRVFFEMFKDLQRFFIPTPEVKITIVDLELILLQGFRYLLRSATSQIVHFARERSVISRLLPILIRHALLDNRSDDILWVRDFGSRLVDSGEETEFAWVVARTIKELKDVNDMKTAGFDVLAMFGGQIITSAIEQISRSQNFALLLLFLRALQVMHDERATIGDVRIDLVFLGTLRTRLIIACYNVGLKVFSSALFQRWREVRCAKPTFELVHAMLSSFSNPSKENQDATRISIRDVERPSNGAPSTVSSNSHCAALIVQQATRGTLWRRREDVRVGLKEVRKKKKGNRSSGLAMSSDAEPMSGAKSANEEGLIPVQVRFAYDILLSFLVSKSREEWNEKDTINIAHMLFRLGHSREAQIAISDLAKEDSKYRENAFATLARGIAERNLEEGIQFLEEKARTKHSAVFVTDKVIGPIFVLAMFEGKIDFIQRLLRLSQKSGATEGLAMRSRNVLTMAAYDKKGTGFKDQFEDSEKDASKIDDLFEDVRRTQHWLHFMLERGFLSTDPDILNKMIIGCLHRGEAIRKSHLRSGNTQRGDATADRMNRIASTLMQHAAQKLYCIDDEAASLILSSFHVGSGLEAKGGKRAYREQKINELDAIVSAMRWVPEYRISQRGHRKDRDDVDDRPIDGDGKTAPSVIKVKSGLIDSNVLINVLPPVTFRSLILAYTRLNDNLGVASIVQWVRDECKMSLEELIQGWNGQSFAKFIKKRIQLASQRGAMDQPDQTLKWISGQESVPLIKSWWYEPKQSEERYGMRD